MRLLIAWTLLFAVGCGSHSATIEEVYPGEDVTVSEGPRSDGAPPFDGPLPVWRIDGICEEPLYIRETPEGVEVWKEENGKFVRMGGTMAK